MWQVNFHIYGPVIIALLVLWLVYRIKAKLKLYVKNEIYDNFPSIKIAIDKFEHRMQNLNSQAEMLEKKLKELQEKPKI